MLSCAGADRLQTGMLGAFRKPLGTCARVDIGQVLLSVRCKESNKSHAMKWGFTKFNRADYVRLKSEGRIVPDGVNAKLLGCHGSLALHHPGGALIDAAVN
ncbi:60S ribosomal protein L10 [Pyrus ussuriensis x Pyrus communis]|uniref:60S ribosomal protein L10 n=1 Tax=Pyrus ussuriensis x Pyrus communis TaxID=2448454 RepID=A0A5N5GHS1_9ROSA|nr:60S ribosomal protein L10 [Pyrus ussuriensis x Pyrus communis]